MKTTLKNEDKIIKNEDNPKNEDNLKMKTTLKMKMTSKKKITSKMKITSKLKTTLQMDGTKKSKDNFKNEIFWWLLTVRATPQLMLNQK